MQVAYPYLESAGYITHRFWLGSCATRMKKRVHRPSHAEARRRKRKLLRTSSKCAAHNDHQKGACLPPTFGANGFVLADFLTPDGSGAGYTGLVLLICNPPIVLSLGFCAREGGDSVESEPRKYLGK